MGSPRPRFRSGWQRSAERVAFSLQALFDLVRRRRRFLLSPSATFRGLREAFGVERMLAMNKSVRFAGRTFISLTLPGYHSAAFDHAVARGALNSGSAGTPAKQQVDNAILAITSRCGYACAHCYEKRNIDGAERISVHTWQETIRELQEIGVSVVILSGGEPMLRYEDLVRLLRSGDKSLSDFHVHTSGFGVDSARAEELRDAGLTAAGIGLDDVSPQRLDALRGAKGAFDTALRAVECFNRAGVLTYLNLCLTPAFVRGGGLRGYFRLAKEIGVGLIEILEPRPCGGFQGVPVDRLLTEEDRRTVAEFVRAGNGDRRYRDYPILYYVAAMESPGTMGCMMGGLSHFSIDAAGNVIPCVFVPVSFGNIREEPLRAIFPRMRSAVPRPVRAGCASVLLAHVYASAPPGTTTRHEDVRGEWSARLRDPEKKEPVAP